MKQLNRNTVSVQKRPIKVLQFGEGNFLRGFVDWIFDILNEKTDFNGDIQIVQPIENGMEMLINQQEGLYHVLLEGLLDHKKTQKTRLITSVRGVLNPYKDYKAFLKLGKNPDLEFIISNTTESGIALDERDKDFNTLPNSFPGKLTALLFYRFLHLKGDNIKPITIIPCELIDRNGDKLKENILRYAWIWRLPDGFKIWLDKNVSFCNTLVDRIVPGFPRDTIKTVQKNIGYEDHLVVKAEPFHLWVIETPNDNIHQKLPIEGTGLNIKYVTDKTPYRTRKVRILNGAHTALVPFGYLNGIRFVREAVENELTISFLHQIIFDEIIPTLDLPKEELEYFAEAVIERFKNPFIDHLLISIALNSISKFKVRVLPTILSYLERKGKLPEKLVQSFAWLLVFYRGYYDDKTIPLKDDQSVISFFQEIWKNEDLDTIIEKILENTMLWDTNLNKVPLLHATLSHEIKNILLKTVF
ncbi:tagaturonate reductase [Aquimarina algicola]|uniref:Tagaturonate reductase n=1 Tax=Aquimarina algicola TaxID=2589995 RepID=A0A504IZM2_9FLAO|nr:tagaturonate reductase [Aquimarina algicola]TPN81208.1 tagaturonate reductase [Aquimarina algicola]